MAREGFRERFKAYKEGKSISEIYDAGLPKYGGGKGPQITRKSTADPNLVPFDWNRRIKLTNAGLATGAVLSESLLDAIAEAAYRRGLPIKTALGLATKESTLGNPTDDTSVYKILSPEKVEYFKSLGTGTHINDAGDALLMEDVVNYHRPDNYPKDWNTFDRAFLFYKDTPYKYNPGQKNHPQLVDKRGEEVWNSPEILKWYKNWEASKIQVNRPEEYKINTNLQNTAVKSFFKNGKLPGFRGGKIGHNVSRALVNDDGTFTDDYTKVFEDMYVTPLKTDLKRNSHTWNSWNYYKSNPTAWMLPFMSSGTNEKGLELVYPEFDLLLGGRQIATLLFPLKSSIKDATEEMINFEDIAKKAAKMKADDDAWRAAHPEYEIENILKKLKLQNAYDPAIEDLVKNANLEDMSLRSVFDKMLYENKDFHGKQIVNLHNNRAKLSGDFVDDAGQVFDVDTPEGYENAILFLEKYFFGTRDGAERLLKDPDFQSRLAGFSMPRGNKPVFISRNKLILRLERDLGRKLTLQEADDLYYKVISHERHHSFDKIHNTPEGFNLDGLSPNDYFVKNGFDELAARGTLLKNMFGLYKNPLTAAHLRYASSQYFKDPSNINNNMTRFFNMITDYDKAAKWLQENATAVLPYAVGGSIVASLPEYKNGKSPIHINPANRGKFNATKKRTGKTTEQLAHSSNPLTRKRAIFALNARKWHH